MNFSRWLFLLKICVTLTLVARGWLTWQWDSPIRSLIWKEDWWSGLLEKQFNLTWSEFATASDSWITQGLMLFGVILMLGGAVPWLLSQKCCPRVRWLLCPLTFLLVIDSVARWVNSDYDFAMAIEHSLQMVTPVALLLATAPRPNLKLWSILVTIAAALTFIGHGFYAAGIHPVPLSYQTMTMVILGVDQGTALTLLSIAGWLDIAFAIGIFFRPSRLISLIYLVGWGAATAAARVVAHFDVEAATWALNPWAFETAVRSSHWMLPLLLLFYYRFRLVPENQSSEPEL